MKFKAGDRVIIGDIEEDDDCETYRICGIVDKMFGLVGKKAIVTRRAPDGQKAVILDNGWWFAEEDLKLENCSLENK